MPAAEEFPALLSPFELAGRRLRNRIVHASMTTRLQRAGFVTAEMIQYQETRARGGAAMIVLEPFAMISQHASQAKVQVRNPAVADGLKRFAEAIEVHDCRLLGQIQDSGRGRREPGRAHNAIGPSHLPDDLSWSMPHALRAQEIEVLIDEFATSSATLKACGFSGVEVSAGHGHLFHQFFSPHANIRTDRYGGDWAGRTRLVAELVAAIRELCGRDFIIGLKLPGNDGVPGSIGPDEAAIVASLLTGAGNVDYVTFAHGAHARTLEMHVPDRYGPRLPYVPLMNKLRSACNGVPVMALGRITDPAEAEGLIARGEAELVGLGRALLADPAWLTKAAQGRAHDIRYCLSCNTCWGYGVMHQKTICCVNNPRVGMSDELDFKPARVTKPRRVVVVGTGVAGLEAAWVAAARGHLVTVFGAGSEVGGKARLRALLPGGETITSIYDYQYPAALRAGARFEHGVVATLDDILSLRPDGVILGTGARMIPPLWLPPEIRNEGLVPDLHTAMQDVIRIKARQPGTAVIYDMDHTDGTYAAAEHLHDLFDRVVIVTAREAIAEDMWLVARQGILRRMYEKRIEIIRLAEPRWSVTFEEGNLEYVNVYNGDVGLIEQVAFLAYSTPQAPQNQLGGELQGAGIPTHLVGDCRSPQDLLHATAEGHAAGNAV